MFVVNGRPMAALALRASRIRRYSTLAAFLLLSQILIAPPLAHAVIVHGVVTDALGKPVPGARVQLIQGQSVVAAGLSGIDGTYEIRSTVGGRFVLLTSSATFYPGIGQDFYGGSSDEVTQNVVLETASVHQEVTVTATGIPMPLAQTSSAVTLIPDSYLATTVGVVDALRQSPGVDVVQQGQMGSLTSLFVRGGNSDANKVLIDGISAEDVGGRFDFGTVSSSGITGLEIYRGPDSVLYGSDAASSTIAFTTPRGSDPKPVVNYTGSAGNFHTYQNEGTVSGAHKRADYLAGYSRVDTSNALPMDEYHNGTAVANLGYDITANTPLRFTLRNADSASGVPNAHDFFGISAAAKQADQDLYSGVTIQNTSLGAWHNLVRYGISRKREQYTQFYPVGQLVLDAYGDQTYYGNTVTIRGANGYSATGQAAIAYGCGTPNPASCYPQVDNSDSNRDELYYQTDYVFPKHIAALFGFRYENERGSFNYPTYFENEAIQRTNFEYTAQISGNIVNRLFYSAGGAVEKNHLYGVAGTPRLGLAYVPVRPGGRVLRGTKLRVNVATGVQEPSLSMDFQSLYTQLEGQGDTAAQIKALGITPIREPRTRTLDVGIDQNIYRDKLIFKAGYFHNAFSHQVEYVDSGILIRPPFNLPSAIAHLYGADVGTLAFHAQGLESELEYQPFSRLFLHAGYTYLNAKVDQSFASSALSVLLGGYPSVNPAFPNIPVGASPFIGSRPFRRPPNMGFFAAQYTGSKFSASLKGAFASRSDDSTFLDYADLAGTDSMLLPNRNLDYGYAKLDANFTYAVRRRVTVFSELDNLLSQQHIGPIGYPALPFTVRAGLKVRIGGE
jgi:vitamin B12 transporter